MSAFKRICGGTPPSYQKFSRVNKKTFSLSHLYVSKRITLIVSAIIIFICLSACGAKSDKDSIVSLHVSAASSLTESLEEIKSIYQNKNPNIKINLNFGASSVLKTQIQEGAEVDVFLSANFSHYDDLDKEGKIEMGSQFAENQLVLVVFHENEIIQSVEDMQVPGTKIIFANDSVPVGKYTNTILENYEKKTPGIILAVENNVVSREENVRQVLAKVALGEGDCAIVYDTDITIDVKNKVRVIKIDEDCNVKGTYWAGVLKNKTMKKESSKFYDFLKSGDAKGVFEKFGFTPI